MQNMGRNRFTKQLWPVHKKKRREGRVGEACKEKPQLTFELGCNTI